MRYPETTSATGPAPVPSPVRIVGAAMVTTAPSTLTMNCPASNTPSSDPRRGRICSEGVESSTATGVERAWAGAARWRISDTALDLGDGYHEVWTTVLRNSSFGTECFATPVLPWWKRVILCPGLFRWTPGEWSSAETLFRPSGCHTIPSRETMSAKLSEAGCRRPRSSAFSVPAGTFCSVSEQVSWGVCRGRTSAVAKTPPLLVTSRTILASLNSWQCPWTAAQFAGLPLRNTMFGSSAPTLVDRVPDEPMPVRGPPCTHARQLTNSGVHPIPPRPECPPEPAATPQRAGQRTACT